MRGTMRGATVLAVTLMLTQACASGGVMQTTQSTPGASGASVQSYAIYGAERHFSLEWEPDERGGKPTVSGYITNQYGLSTRNVRLRVEALDAAGGVTAMYIGYVNGYVNPGFRIYFEVPVREKAPKYRVSVLSFDPMPGFGP